MGELRKPGPGVCGALRAGQQGAALVTSLMVMLVTVLLSLAAIGSSVLQEKMTGALADGHRALQAAEAGLRAAEAQVESLSSLDAFGSGTGYYQPGTAPAPEDPAAWSESASRAVSLADGAGSARYFIELQATLDAPGYTPLNIAGYGEASRSEPVTVFRLVAQGRGQNGAGKRVLVVHYSRTF